MKLKVGEMIKRLRKEREITQEEFAEVLGVSCQSVSRWENGTCYPDMELIPTIAGFFAVSVDKLLGVDEEMEKKAVDAYMKRIKEALNRAALEESIQIAREGVAEFPNNYTLLNELMYTMFLITSSDADIPNWKENQEKYDGEIVALGERIMKYCPDVELRTEATARLAFQHCEMGRKAIGRSIYELIPTMVWCRERSIWWALEEKEKVPYTKKYMQHAYEHMMDACDRLVHILPAKEALAVLDKYEALECLVEDNQQLFGTWANADNHSLRAKYLLELGRVEEALEHLKIAAEAAVAADCFPEELKLNSVLLGERTFKSSDDERVDSRTDREYFKDRWLTEDAYAPVREREEFKEILELLK